MRKIEVIGLNQTILENSYHSKINEINDNIKKCMQKYNDWENVDEKTKSIFHTREEYKRRTIDYMRLMRAGYIHKLHDVRNGYIYE